MHCCRWWYLYGLLGAFVAIATSGCGTTRWTDTQRTATEQVLLSSAVERAVSAVDFSVLAGKSVYFDATYLKGVTDENYVISTLRQHLLASGCILKEKREDADLVVEARSGAIGTDRAEVLYGIPATTLPAVSFTGVPAMPTTLPEIAVARKTEQMGVAKIAVFAFNRTTGEPLWQSGIQHTVSNAKDIWVLGTGPYRTGSIRNRIQVVGSSLSNAILATGGYFGPTPESPRVAQELYYEQGRELFSRQQSGEGHGPLELTPKPAIAQQHVAAPVATPAAERLPDAPLLPSPADPASWLEDRP